MKSSEIRERNTEELGVLLQQMNENLFKKKFDKALNQLPKSHEIRQLKKDIAKVKTIIREREIAAAKQG